MLKNIIEEKINKAKEEVRIEKTFLIETYGCPMV